MTMKFTPKEIQVLSGMIDGLSDKEIAERTGIGIHVIRTHLRTSIFRKLGARNRTQAAVIGWTHGITANGNQHKNNRRAGLSSILGAGRHL